VKILHARDNRKYPVALLCALLGVTKQAFYKVDEAKALLEEHGFTSSAQGEATDKSMRSIGMFSPTGFSFSLVEHIRH
jgi:hypothetical protein